MVLDSAAKIRLACLLIEVNRPLLLRRVMRAVDPSETLAAKLP
jgi:hypothetical protein